MLEDRDRAGLRPAGGAEAGYELEGICCRGCRRWAIAAAASGRAALLADERASAVLGGASAISFVGPAGKARFPTPAPGEVDILPRNTTWTLSRDVDR